MRDSNPRGVRTLLDPIEIVLSHPLQQQEAAIGFAAVRDPMRRLGPNRVAGTHVYDPVLVWSAGFDGKLAGEAEIPIGDLAVEVPRNDVAGGQRI